MTMRVISVVFKVDDIQKFNQAFPLYQAKDGYEPVELQNDWRENGMYVGEMQERLEQLTAGTGKAEVQ